MPKHIFRHGDIVTITDPQEFLRCGYAMTHDEVMSHVEGQYSSEINEAYKLFDLKHVPGHMTRRMCALIAYYKMSEAGLGGPERTIHRRMFENYCPADTYIVRNKRTVRTGTYYSPYHASHYEDDSETGGLTNAKTHIILTLEGHNSNQFYALQAFEIEAICCKIKNE